MRVDVKCVVEIRNRVEDYVGVSDLLPTIDESTLDLYFSYSKERKNIMFYFYPSILLLVLGLDTPARSCNGDTLYRPCLNVNGKKSF